ncbi:MAG: RagB/SusD family nutrient uptake outer membrane protein [Dysgonamonadaceae bacterium]|nr:RagB/SusD family nutrient uptake outer membrane protein [Dysgonamonadaceae bacterium]MDD4727292.1 RagB/SusD family nutrient uptake outer membrane protein [Dysgonamonadaceae bacterium]
MKNKNLLSIIAFVSFVLMFAGCSDLDTLPGGDEVTSSQKEDVYDRNPDRAEAGVNAIFAQFNQFTPNKDAFGDVERHNDIGYPSIMLFTDANGNDVVSEDNGYNWMGFNLEFTDRSYTSREVQIVWNNFYSMIYTANSVIGANDPETEDPTSQYYLAQGLSARAFSYFGLAQLFQFNYKGNESKPAVPLVTDKNADEIGLVGGAPRATVEEVYTQILSDLNLAIELLESAEKGGVTPKDKRYVSLAVAYGLRARVHLTMHKYPEAGNDASSAITESGAEPSSLDEASKLSFIDAKEEDNWMWGIIIAETDRVVTSGIVNWYSHMGSFNGNGYSTVSKGLQINKKLYKSIPDSDVRKGWWINENKVSYNLTEEQQDFIDGIGYAPFTQVKFGPYKNEVGTSTNASDIPLMRIEEMYLIKAEADGMNGNSGSLESFIQEYRDPDYTFSGTAAQIQEEVFRQRRIELWGEGLSWYDIMRLNKGVDRRGGGYPNATMIFNIPSGSDILLWRIPEAEIQANPVISEADNNPSAPAPSPVADNS